MKNRYYLTGLWYNEEGTPYTFFYRLIASPISTIGTDANIQHLSSGTITIETDAPLPFQLKTPVYLADGKRRLIISMTPLTYQVNKPSSRIVSPNCVAYSLTVA